MTHLQPQKLVRSKSAAKQRQYTIKMMRFIKVVRSTTNLFQSRSESLVRLLILAEALLCDFGSIAASNRVKRKQIRFSFTNETRILMPTPLGFFSTRRLIVLLAIVLFANMNPACAFQLQFELINNGQVIANTSNSNNDDTAFPSVIRLPNWLAAADRADPSANYYMYYGNHTGDYIKLKWAASIGGTWTDYDIDAGTINGVFDVGGNDPTRDDYDHISAPDVIVDDANQRFVMYFHGDRDSSSPAPTVHERFVATSATGLNFNDPVSGNGEPGHGPVEVTVLTDEGLTRDVWIGDDYMKVFEKNGRFYGVGKRGIINAAPATGNIWAQPTGPDDDDPFREAWDREDTPESNWSSYTTGPNGSQDDYHSPGASFLASQEFADHPNNPESRRIYSNGSDERLNHVDVNLLPGNLLEVFFYVKEASRSSPDDYNAIYRIVYDISDDDFQNWTIARDGSGQAIFDVVLTPEAVTAAVIQINGPNFNPELYADPSSLGDTELFIDTDGEKYLFFSYVSIAFGGIQGEGQITAVRLIDPAPGDNYVTLEAESLTSATDPNGDGDTWQIVADADAHGGQAIQAPGTSRVDLASGPHDAIATLEVVFPQQGIYTAYYRAYGVSGTTNSFYAPSRFGVEPTINQTTDRDGEFTWSTGEPFIVWPTDFGTSLEIQIGRRERDNRVDAIVFHERDDLTEQELDALFAPPFLLGDVNLDGTVNFLDINPFISLLSAGGFQDEADIDRTGTLNFLDISPFISLLSGQ